MNEHHEEAQRLIDLANLQTLGLTERQIIATQAQAEATLALAYEQARAADEARTANLLAFERSQWEAFRRNELTAEGVELWERLAKQLKERGLA